MGFPKIEWVDLDECVYHSTNIKKELDRKKKRQGKKERNKDRKKERKKERKRKKLLTAQVKLEKY